MTPAAKGSRAPFAALRGGDRRWLVAVSVLTLTACGDEPRGNAVDIDAAAARAQRNIDNYGAAAGAAGGSAVPADKARRTAEPPPAATNTPAVSERDARAVVDRYYTLVAAGRARESRALWDDKADADRAVTDATRVARLHATTGAPFGADAGAGQRYVSVPVRLDGIMRAGGGRYRAEATVILHRVAEGIDGATAADRRWHIARIESAPAGMPEAATASYRCDDGQTATVRFDHAAGTALLTIDGRTALLAATPTESGFGYQGNGYALRGKGKAAALTGPGGVAVGCTAD